MAIEKSNSNSNIIAIAMMIILLGMIGFVTNLAAPIGTIWKNEYAGSNWLGMLGNFMNFAAYGVIGIPAGKLLERVGYKKTALSAIIVGFLGMGIQFISGKIVGFSCVNWGFFVYLSGAFVGGISVCMLNTVVNPMLNEMGGGGKKGGALLQAGGACNSFFATLAPILVGSLIGEVTVKTTFSDINPVLFISMGVFALVGIVLYFIDIPESDVDRKIGDLPSEHSAWSFRHFVLGAIGIFVYVGIEIGIPNTMKFFLEDKGKISPAEAGTIAGTFWFLMLIGRLLGTGVANKIGSKILLAFASGIAILLVGAAICMPISEKIEMPAFTGKTFVLTSVPVSAFFLVLVGLCASVMWGGIFNLAVEGLGKYVATASGIYMTMVMGGGIIPEIQHIVVDITKNNYMFSYWIPLIGLVYLFYYALFGSKNVNKDIPV